MGQVIQFRRPQAYPVPAKEPSQADMMGFLAACLITGLSDEARSQFNSRIQRAYDRAGNDERRELVRAAAEWICVPIERGA